MHPDPDRGAGSPKASQPNPPNPSPKFLWIATPGVALTTSERAFVALGRNIDTKSDNVSANCAPWSAVLGKRQVVTVTATLS